VDARSPTLRPAPLSFAVRPLVLPEQVTRGAITIRFADLNPAPTAPEVLSKPPPFINVIQYDGIPEVRFAVKVEFDLNTGHRRDWERRQENDEEDAEGE